jgi:hypothetical protein
MAPAKFHEANSFAPMNGGHMEGSHKIGEAANRKERDEKAAEMPTDDLTVATDHLKHVGTARTRRHMTAAAADAATAMTLTDDVKNRDRWAVG